MLYLTLVTVFYLMLTVGTTKIYAPSGMRVKYWLKVGWYEPITVILSLASVSILPEKFVEEIKSILDEPEEEV